MEKLRPPYGREAPKNGQGFTLIEVTVVLLLLVLMAGLSMVYIAGRLPSATLDASAREIAAAIRHSRSLALMNGEEQKIVVDLDLKRFGREGSGFRKIPREVGIMALDPLYGEVRSGQYEIGYAANGGAKGGDLVLWNHKRVVTIRLDPILGSVSIRR